MDVGNLGRPNGSENAELRVVAADIRGP